MSSTLSWKYKGGEFSKDMHMYSISQLFDRFADAYKHSLYAIEQEEQMAKKKRVEARANIKKHYERERSKSATKTVNDLMANLHKLNEICAAFCDDEETVIRTAEFLVYGKIKMENLEKLIFSDTSIPCVFLFSGMGVSC